MRACATANAALLGASVAAGVFVACTSGLPSPESAPYLPTDTEATPPRPAAIASVEAAPRASADAPLAPNPTASAADCRELVTDITNDPPAGGVVMNNAMTSGDAGSSDRLASIIELIKSRREAFRCCFDLWGRKNPGGEGHFVLKVSIAPDGALRSSEVDASRSDVSAPEVTSCVVELAKSMTWPVSPSSHDTVYSHLFNFKARR